MLRAAVLPPKAGVTRVAVDVQMLGPGGGNGGIKPTILGQLRLLENYFPGEFEFVFLVNRRLRPEVVAHFPRSLCISVSGDARPLMVRPSRRSPLLGRLAVRTCKVVYAPVWYSPFLSPKRNGVVLFVDMLHRDHPTRLSSEVERLWREEIISCSARLANRIQCISHAMEHKVANYYAVEPARLFVTYLVLDDRSERSASAEQTRDGARRFIYPANLWSHKAHDVLLRAFADYRSQGGTWDLILTGFELQNPRIAELSATCRQLGVSASVHMLGHLAPAHFQGVLASSGALVFPSNYEGFGMPVWEAMTNGLPVVASRIPALVEIAGDAALYCAAGSVDELSRALGTIAGDAELRRCLRQRGLARAKSILPGTEVAKLAHAFRSPLVGRPGA